MEARQQAVPVQLHIEAVNAKDRRAFLEGLRGHSAPLKAALDRLKKRPDAREVQVLLADIERNEAQAFAEGERAKAAARSHAAAAAAKIAILKKQDASLLELLDESTAADGPHRSAAAASLAGTGRAMATDLLVHGVARREGAPMASFLQALADSATDCMVLQTLHARMGVRAHCAV
jgi:hypothetical protein